MRGERESKRFVKYKVSAQRIVTDDLTLTKSQSTIVSATRTRRPDYIVPHGHRYSLRLYSESESGFVVTQAGKKCLCSQHMQSNRK